MRLLATPSWSFGREKALLQEFRAILSHPAVQLHYCEANVDQNRCITAFSAEGEVVADMVFRLALAAFDTIDLNRHIGTYPRIGALDNCPLTSLDPDSGQMSLMRSLAVAENLAGRLAATFEIPVFLQDRSERGRHEAELSNLRKGGFGTLLNSELRPDFGPNRAHSKLGACVLGVRDFQISLDLYLKTDDLSFARTMAGKIREMRMGGDERMLGVRSLGLPAPSEAMVQLVLNLTLPDVTSVDPIVRWIEAESVKSGVKLSRIKLVGAIREKDLSGASRLQIDPDQVADR